MKSAEIVAIEREAGWRLYCLLALFDARRGSPLDDLVRSAREGYEREHFEDDAWAEFDRIWNSYTSSERLQLTRDAGR